MEIRQFKKSDSQQVAQLLHDSVKIPDAEGYSETQTRFPAPDNIHYRDWEESFLQKFTIVAEIKNKIIGIVQLEDTGHISCFYCHEDYRRQGIGTRLYEAVEEKACTKNIPTLYTETNEKDRAFYFMMGFREVQKQNVLVRGEVKASFVIEKTIFS